MKQVWSFLLVSLISCTTAQQTKNVLFLGNSYTATNQLPVLLDQLAVAAGNNIIRDQNTPGGFTFEGHTTNANSLNKISSNDWDFVVLQEQSQKPSFPPGQVSAETYPYAAILNDSIKSNNPCTEPLFYMTWGRKNGDASNCGNYPPLCTYDGMQQRLRESYMEMALDNDASVAPVGVAWKTVRDTYPAIELYSPDESHPSLAGSYLAACVFYCSIFRESVLGNTYTSSLDSLTAYRLQNIATNTVLDSMDLWRIGSNDLSVSAISDTSLCGDSLELSVTGTYTSLVWNTTETNNSITVDTSGLYFFEAQNIRGCNIFDSAQVSIVSAYMDTFNFTECDSLDLNGQIFTEDTSYIQNFQSVGGCDSIVHVNIEIDTTVVPDVNFAWLLPVKSDAYGIWFGVYSNYGNSFVILNEHFDSILSGTAPFDYQNTYYCPDSLDDQSHIYYLILQDYCRTDTFTLMANCGPLTSSINDLNTSWKISPIPSSNYLNISNSKSINFSAEMFDMLSQKVNSYALTETSFLQIDLSGLELGNYFLVLKDKDKAIIGKKLIQKN